MCFRQRFNLLLMIISAAQRMSLLNHLQLQIDEGKPFDFEVTEQGLYLIPHFEARGNPPSDAGVSTSVRAECRNAIFINLNANVQRYNFCQNRIWAPYSYHWTNYASVRREDFLEMHAAFAIFAGFGNLVSARFIRTHQNQIRNILSEWGVANLLPARH